MGLFLFDPRRRKRDLGVREGEEPAVRRPACHYSSLRLVGHLSTKGVRVGRYAPWTETSARRDRLRQRMLK